MTKIKINNILVSVEFVDKTDNENILGTFYAKQSKIVVLKSLDSGNKKMTLIHEITHAFIWCYGFKGGKLNDEDICNFVGAYGEKIIDYANKILANEKNKGEK